MNQPATCDYRFSPASFSRCVFWPHATSLPFPNRDLMSERRIHLLGASSPTSANSSSVRSVRWSNSHQPSPASEHSRARRSARMASAPWRCPRACSISLSMRRAVSVGRGLATSSQATIANPGQPILANAPAAGCLTYAVATLPWAASP